MTTITLAREEVETLAADIVEYVATGELGRLHDFERELWPRLLAFGRALVALYLVRWYARPRPSDSIIGGARYMDRGRTLGLGSTMAFLVGPAIRIRCREHGVVVAAVP